jgi:hypothetical protein
VLALWNPIPEPLFEDFQGQVFEDLGVYFSGHNNTSDFSEDSQGTLWLGKQICVPNLKHINVLILREAHDSAYSIHPDSTKMYKDLKTQYWWYGMKRDVIEYIALYETC